MIAVAGAVSLLNYRGGKLSRAKREREREVREREGAESASEFRPRRFIGLSFVSGPLATHCALFTTTTAYQPLYHNSFGAERCITAVSSSVERLYGRVLYNRRCCTSNINSAIMYIIRFLHLDNKRTCSKKKYRNQLNSLMHYCFQRKIILNVLFLARRYA